MGISLELIKVHVVFGADSYSGFHGAETFRNTVPMVKVSGQHGIGIEY